MTVLRSPLQIPLRSPLRIPGVMAGARQDIFGAQLRARLLSGRVDFLSISDSNAIFGGTGWDHGFGYALDASGYDMWATALVAQNEGGGSGSGQGYLYNRAGSLIGAASGAPAGLDELGGIGPASYTYVADGNSTSTSVVCGLYLLANCPIDNGAALTFDHHTATFDFGSGQYRTTTRLEQSPFSTIAANAARNTNEGVQGMIVDSVTLPVDATRTAKQISGKPIAVSNTAITGPYFGTYYRFRNTGRTAGYSFGTMIYAGGGSLRTMAAALQGYTDESLTHYLGILLDNQDQDDKCIVIRINSGLNDRNETNTSVGTAAVTDGDSAEAFVDNLDAIVQRIYEIFDLNEWDRSWLWWIVTPSHPVSAPDNAELLAYRAAAKEYCKTLPQSKFIDLAKLTTYAEMLANGDYATGGSDTNHLTTTGYNRLAALELAAIGL